MKPKFILIGLVILVAVIVVAYQALNSNLSNEAYITFQNSLDKAVGQGNWNAGEHEFQLANKSLVVKDLKLNLKAINPEITEPLVFDKVEISGGLRLSSLEKLLGLTDWKSQEDTNIADNLILSGGHFNIKHNNNTGIITLGELNLKGVRLLASDGNNSSGPLGFIKSARINDFIIKNLKLTLNDTENPENTLEAQAELYQLVKPELGENVTDINNILGLLFSFKAQEAKAENWTLNVTLKDPTANFTAKLASVRNVGLDKGKSDIFDFNGLEINGHLDKEDIKDFSFSLGSVSIPKLDTTYINQKLAPLFDALLASKDEELDIDKTTDIYNKIYNVADFVVAPYSMESGTLRDLKFSLDNALSVSIAEFSITGPYVGGFIPELQTAKITGFNISLPNDPSFEQNKIWSELYKFTKDFGQNSFDISYDLKSTYDPVKGEYLIDLNNFEVKDLLNITYQFQFGGLTGAYVEKLKAVSLEQIEQLISIPETLALSLNNFSLSLTDKTLLDKIYATIAANQGQTKDATKAGVVAGAGIVVAMGLGNKVENSQEVADSLTKFLDSSGTLTLKASPSPPLNALSFTTTPESEIFNSLNINLTYNSETPVVLKFNSSGQSFDSPDALEDFDNDLEEFDQDNNDNNIDLEDEDD